MFADGVLDGVPHGVRAGHVQFPVLAYGLELGEIYEDPVLDGLGTGIGVDDGTKRVLRFHELVPFGACSCVHRAPYRSLPIGGFATPWKVKRWMSAEAACHRHQRGGNE